MNGLEFVRNLLDETYAYLVAYKKFPDDVANSLVGNILMDLSLKWGSGLTAHLIFMNPDGYWMFVCDTDFYTDYSPYYCIATNDKRIPEIEYNSSGIPQVYDTLESVHQALWLYNDYFSNDAQAITKYKP